MNKNVKLKKNYNKNLIHFNYIVKKFEILLCFERPRRKKEKTLLLKR